MKQENCKTCGKNYTPLCEYRQGRCPHHPAMFDISKIKTKFANLISFLKRK
jgi:hypothetical protein